MVRTLSRKSSTTVFGSTPVAEQIPPMPSHELLARLRDLDCAGDRIVCGPNGAVCKHPARGASMSRGQSDMTSHMPNHSFHTRDEQLRAAQSSLAREMRNNTAESYCKPFCDFMSANPTAYHAVATLSKDLESAGFTELHEADNFHLKPGGKYYVTRNGTTLIAFAVGKHYQPGNGVVLAAGHIDQVAYKLKGSSRLPTRAGYTQLNVAGYARPGPTWWDRDLGIAGRVLVRQGNKIVTKLVRLHRPIARIPTLAPHFGALSQPPFNPETQEVPILGLDCAADAARMGSEGSFACKQPPRLVKEITRELDISDCNDIVSWDLELYDVTPAARSGLDNEFIAACRLDDKLCSWAAVQALINSTSSSSETHADSSVIKMTAVFDNEEVGSLTRQGARSNFLLTTLTRTVMSLTSSMSSMSAYSSACPSESVVMGRTFAKSFCVSSDVTHAIHPNFLQAYDQNNYASLNVGMCVEHEANYNMTTDAISSAIYEECAARVGHTLQHAQKRDDTRGGGTIGPYIASQTGIRTLDAGCPQLSMHSIRAMTGALDPGLGVQMYQALFDEYEDVERQFA